MTLSLHAFSSGTLRSHKHLFTMGRGVGVPFEVPVPFFLVRHPLGLVLFDTGNALEVATDKLGHWGADVVASYDPAMRPDEHVVAQLAFAGVAPDQIRFVVQSHLHLDHAGGVGCFPKAQVIVQRRELEYAYVPDFFMAKAYIRADFDRPGIRWRLLDGDRDEGFDLFGDGALTIVNTPGHTPGHQSLLVRLPRSGPTLLTGDSVYVEEILDDDVLPGLVYSPSDAVRSINRMRDLRSRGVRIITGHDPEAWARLEKALD